MEPHDDLDERPPPGDGSSDVGVPDPWAHDPLSRPAVPASEATDPLSRTDRADALEAARALARTRLWRALAGTAVLPLTVISEVPLGWIVLDNPILDWLLVAALVLSVLLWGHWAAAVTHRNAWEGEMMMVEDDEPEA